ncbi:hypothetical protein Bca4012_010217 [Brassica carinata]|uniref:Uncharacterized protein n=1 Tax=Brassica carinata TaxID=52824 RepID=A0A8X7V1I2_BRACI|nr:hypothetical protein Bca52824_035196 [Brassica carinata]
MEKDPIVSQYEAQLHGSTYLSKSTNGQTIELPAEPVHATPLETPPVHDSPVHNISEHTLSVHTSLVHTSVINISIQNNSPPNLTLFVPTPTSIRPPSVIYDASAHPNSPPLHHLLFHKKEIFEPISPNPPSLTQPRYDSSNNQASKRQIFMLSPLLFTPETSPNKSSDSLQGFMGHATATNTFSATTTSKPLSFANSIQSDLQSQTLDDIVEQSDGSPTRKRQGHMPCLVEGFHITRSKFDFSTNLLLEPAEPQHWTTTYQLWQFAELCLTCIGSSSDDVVEAQQRLQQLWQQLSL